jgi:hypothetical protein
VVVKIISGGQTGADRGGLEAALALGIPHGGYCPLGRKAEDGVIPGRYTLEEITTANYAARTAMNVKLADATLLLVWGKAALAKSRGTKLTLDMCIRYKKPWWAADPRQPAHVDRVRGWLEELCPQVLNIAGPRESRARGIQEQTARFVEEVLRGLPR